MTVNDELTRVWKEEVVAYFKLLAPYLHGRARYLSLNGWLIVNPDYSFHVRSMHTYNKLNTINYLRYIFSMALPAHSGPMPLIQFHNHFSKLV
jgi:hypothetical protein